MPTIPAFEAVHAAGGSATARLARDYAEALCAGHFPGDPFLPGAYLVEVMAELAAVALGVPGTVPVAVERAAFRFPVRPDDRAEVIARGAASDAVEAEVRVGGRPAARARLRFALPA